MSETENDAFLQTPASAKHKKERIWQIFVPIGVICVVVLTALIFLIIQDARGYAPGISNFAASATILVILPVLLLALINLALIIALIYGMVKLRGAVRPLGSRLLKGLENARWKISNFSDAAARVLMTINEKAEMTNQALRSLNKRLNDKRN